MMGAVTGEKRRVKWRWPEQLAGGYLGLFMLITFLGPVSGWLQPPNNINLGRANLAPFTSSRLPDNGPVYWLGTDHLGRDVLANLVYGARTALLVSLPAMLLATVIGLTLGSLAGFWGNTGFRTKWISVLMSFILLPLSFYYIFYIRQMHWMHAFRTGSTQILLEVGRSSLVFILLVACGWLTAKMLQWVGFRKSITLPIDQLILTTIEIVGAIPRLLLIMCLMAFAQPALVTIVLLAAFTYWTSIARLIRGELLQVKELPFIAAARVAGLPEIRILFRHALLNALPPVIVAVAFGLGNLMSLEATLSFLGIGIPAEVPSWGRIMNGIRSDFRSWWLLLFPALTLCSTILSLQIMAQRILRWLNPIHN